MSSKKNFPRVILVILAILLVSGPSILIRYKLNYPAKLGPKFNPIIKNEPLINIESEKPAIVLIGDSTLGEGVDETLLSDELGLVTYRAAIPGSGTAAWYLFMKNIIFEADFQPDYVVVLFRTTILTIPQYRTGGKYFYLLDDYARKEEPLVADLAFVKLMNPLEKFTAQYIPAYAARVDIRKDLDNALRYPLPALVGCDHPCTDDAVGSIFGREVDPLALNVAQEDAAKLLYAPEEMDFDHQVETSLLPYMIKLTQQHGVTLILVRTKVYGPETPELKQYTKDLDEYLAAQEGVILLDYASDPRILESYYADTLHMNPYGKHEFTKILADDLRNIILK
ncbi:hypothetical protein MASR2M66_23920 [Chloroflexota bacterium]